MDLAKQYNSFADDFSQKHDTGETSNRFNREIFYGHLDFVKPGIKLLDLACGDGLDLLHYQKLGAEVYGLDASEELLKIAKEKLPQADLKVGLFEKLPYEDNYFDAVVSKYAIMTSADMAPVFSEIHRTLKPGGIMMYLATHPFRQFFEKKDAQGDYFKQTVVDSNIFNGAITIKEPTHTMKEYFNDFLFKNFEVLAYDEQWEPAAEVIEGKKYPGFFILKAKKK